MARPSPQGDFPLQYTHNRYRFLARGQDSLIRPRGNERSWGDSALAVLLASLLMLLLETLLRGMLLLLVPAGGDVGDDDGSDVAADASGDATGAGDATEDNWSLW